MLRQEIDKTYLIKITPDIFTLADYAPESACSRIQKGVNINSWYQLASFGIS
jgi:hypothetical protein